MTTALQDVQEIQLYPFPFVHPEELELSDIVHVYAALIDSHYNIVNEKDFISYTCTINLEVSFNH